MIHARPDYNGRFIDVAGKIPNDEPVFMLRAQDIHAADTVRHWATLNRIHGSDPELSVLADAHADKMQAWPVKKLPDGPAEKPAKPKKPHPEKILGISRAALEELNEGPLWQGFKTPSSHTFTLADVLDNCELRVRDEVEEDESWKQIIPYVYFTLEGDLDHPLVLTYSRGAASGESRLTSLQSLGFGGHIEESDYLPDTRLPLYSFEQAVRRELAEEVRVGPLLRQLVTHGFLNDDTNPVGRVHLGVVQSYSLRSPLARAKEHNVVDGPAFVAVPLLKMLRPWFEPWSQILIDELNSGSHS